MVKDYIIKSFDFLSDEAFVKIAFFIKNFTWLDLSNPRTFPEKINYIKVNKHQEALRRLVSDRISVRRYVEKKTNDCRLISVLWSGITFDEKTWEELPKKFVIKATHGSKMVKVVDKEKVCFEDIEKEVNAWKYVDYANKSREWYYSSIEKKIIVEEFIETDDGCVPPDYKFFCINGKVCLIQVDIERFINHERNFYTADFELMPITLNYNRSDKCIEKPSSLEKAIDVAEGLSVDFDFIRVDLYLVGENVYFGEMTNIPDSGLAQFTPKQFNYSLGEKLNIRGE
ncbi:TupA-like ATPgrasp [Modicisalibacter muralis]|uniref:TupA-like ATPgrasp n=1 Tax=Modicisalibacter muralis TaxID=119000 RepID=A0A1G9EUN7_9GAMM|nr:ATP-grasp fold amidoligase family protein [Halomonas muralis]SDK79793.1 TupA-like ATPgrasp [Halomonas muralis]